MNRMKKPLLGALWAQMLLTLSAVTAFADVVPEPEPELTGPGTPRLTVLIVAVVIIAVAVIVWVLIRRSK